MSASEPWRLEPAQPVQHASYHSVLGSERSQPMRSRPAQPVTCSSAQGAKRGESGRHVTYPTPSHMELVRENEPARPVTWPNTQEAGSVKPAGPVHWTSIEVSQPTTCEPARSMTYMNEKKSVGSDTMRSLTLPWSGGPPIHEPVVNMTLPNEQEARRTKPAEFETCHDEQISGRNRSLQYIDAHLAERVESSELPTLKTYRRFGCNEYHMNVSNSKPVRFQPVSMDHWSEHLVPHSSHHYHGTQS